MRLRVLIVFCVVLAACREEPSVSQPPPAEAPSTPPTSSQTGPPDTSSEEEVRTLVSEFGGKLQLVSLLAPPDAVERSIREHYAPFVSPALLQKWIADPAAAPGRKVSSPWPDRIEITAVKQAGMNRHEVEGEIVEITSDQAVVLRVPVHLTVEEGRITEYSGANEASDGAEAALTVLQEYYAAINGRDYDRAYRFWSGEGSASGQSLDQFRKGFADTAAVEIRTGTPGRIDPAAGSRYIEIPIEITATTIAGQAQRFRGHYVLRRSVVDGATAEQRQWHIASAKISRVGP